MVYRPLKFRILVHGSADKLLRDYAAEGVPTHEVLRRGLAAMKAFKSARERGCQHMGFVSDPTKLDIELVNL